MKLISGLAAVAVAATTFVPTAATAAPVPPTQLVTDWMSSQLAGGLAVGDFGPDIGLSIDAGLAFDAVDRTADADLVGNSIGDGLVGTGPYEFGYVTSGEYDYPDDVTLPPVFKKTGRYANATAKAAAFTGRIGRDPSSEYEDVDLVAQLEDLTNDTTGFIADDTSYANYANAIGQAFAAEALARAGSAEAVDAREALLAQQCPAGYFLFTLGSTDCGAVPSADTTALVVIALRESGIQSAQVAGAVSLASQWLESVQLPDGAFAGDASTPGRNANSTGLAGWALGKVGRTTSAAKAAAWTRTMQVADAGACASKAPTGAIAYNAEDLAAARADGITVNSTVRDKWRRATFQSAPVLQWAPAATAALSVSAPAKASASSKVDVVVRGLAAGEAGCVTLGPAKRPVTGTGGDLTVSFDLPATVPATHTFTVTTLAGTSSATTAVAAPVPPSAPTAGDLDVARVVKVGRNNVVKAEVACEGTETCAGKLKIRSVGKVTLPSGQKRRIVLAKSSYSVEPGATETVKAKLTKPARAVLGTKRLRVVVVQTARGVEPTSTKFWIRRK